MKNFLTLLILLLCSFSVSAKIKSTQHVEKILYKSHVDLMQSEIPDESIIKITKKTIIFYYLNEVQFVFETTGLKKIGKNKYYCVGLIHVTGSDSKYAELILTRHNKNKIFVYDFKIEKDRLLLITNKK